MKCLLMKLLQKVKPLQHIRKCLPVYNLQIQEILVSVSLISSISLENSCWKEERERGRAKGGRSGEMEGEKEKEGWREGGKKGWCKRKGREGGEQGERRKGGGNCINHAIFIKLLIPRRAWVAYLHLYLQFLVLTLVYHNYSIFFWPHFINL